MRLRVRDGVAHNVDGQRTISVVRAYLAALVEARRSLGSTASATELEYGAAALDFHMPVAVLRRLGSVRSSVGTPLPLIVAVDVVRRGVPMDSVGRRFVELVQVHATDTEFIELLLRVGVARAQGSSVLAAYRAGLDAIRSAHRSQWERFIEVIETLSVPKAKAGI